MTDKQPEALRLAEQLNKEIVRTVELDMMHHQAAVELRLQDSQIQYLSKLVAEKNETIAELVEALKEIITWYGARDSSDTLLPAINQNPEIYEAMRVIAKATGENND